jgi:hypothetical protein
MAEDAAATKDVRPIRQRDALAIKGGIMRRHLLFALACCTVAGPVLAQKILYESITVDDGVRPPTVVESGDRWVPGASGNLALVSAEAAGTAEGLGVGVLATYGQDAEEGPLTRRLAAFTTSAAVAKVGDAEAVARAWVAGAQPDPIDEYTEAELLEKGAATVHALIVLDPSGLPPPLPLAARELERLRLGEKEALLLRRTRLREHKQAILDQQLPMIKAMQARGATVVERFAFGNVVAVEASQDVIRSLAALPGVRRISLPHRSSPDSIDGWESMKGVQVEQYVDAGSDGAIANPDRSSWGHLVLGVIDSGFNTTIPAFKDDANNSRVVLAYDCDVAPCTLQPGLSQPWAESRHGNISALIAAGDLLDGQDPTVSGATDRRARSGMSREARLILVKSGDSSSFCRALDIMSDWLADMVTISHSWDFPDPDGVSAEASCLNDAARLGGVFVVKSAGNSCNDLDQPSPDGHRCWFPGVPHPPEATVRFPGNATYAFVVGSMGQTTAGDASTVQSFPVTYDSSQGGVPFGLGTRSVVAVVAPGCRDLVPQILQGGGTTFENVTGAGCGTSSAAPAFAGGALDFKDSWLRADPTHTWLANSTGRLFATLLLMNDRQPMLPSATSGFHKIWGGGRMRMRQFTPAGMDAPFQFGSFATTLQAVGTNVLFSVNGGAPLAPAVDRLIVTLWWPEPNQANSGANAADIILTVRTTCGGSTAFSDSSFDTKKRVVLRSTNDPGGKCFQVEANALKLPPNPWLSGQHKRTIYVSWYFEDENRNDADGPPQWIQ